MKKRNATTWVISISLVFFFGAIYSYFAWGNLQNFNEQLDPCERLFCDFAIHYYPTAHSIFETREPIYGYLYSPFFAILTSPLDRLPLDSAVPIWGLIQIVLTLLLFITPLFTWKLDRLQEQLLYAGIFFTSLPVLHNFKWGQVSSLMALTIIAAFLAHRSGRSIWAGVLIGISTSIKYYPAIFILYFLLKKDKRAVLAFGLTCLLLLFIVPVLALDWDHWLSFMSLSLQKLSTLSDTVDNPNTQYFPYILVRWLNIDPSRIFVIHSLRMIGFLIALCNLCLFWWINKREMDPDGLLSISILFCTLPFVIETSWHHYFIFLPFLQIALLRLKNKQPWMIFVLVFSMVLSSVFLVNLFPTWQDYTKWGFSFLSSSLILFVTYVLAFKNYREGQRNIS